MYPTRQSIKRYWSIATLTSLITLALCPASLYAAVSQEDQEDGTLKPVAGITSTELKPLTPKNPESKNPVQEQMSQEKSSPDERVQEKTDHTYYANDDLTVFVPVQPQLFETPIPHSQELENLKNDRMQAFLLEEIIKNGVSPDNPPTSQDKPQDTQTKNTPPEGAKNKESAPNKKAQNTEEQAPSSASAPEEAPQTVKDGAQTPPPETPENALKNANTSSVDTSLAPSVKEAKLPPLTPPPTQEENAIADISQTPLQEARKEALSVKEKDLPALIPRIIQGLPSESNFRNTQNPDDQKTSDAKSIDEIFNALAVEDPQALESLNLSHVNFQKYPRIHLSILDKFSGETKSFILKVGQELHLDPLVIVARACLETPPEERLQTSAYIVIQESKRSLQPIVALKHPAPALKRLKPLPGSDTQSDDVKNSDMRAQQKSATSQEDMETLFSGFMFAQSPGLNALEDPYYDVWVNECLPASDETSTKTKSDKLSPTDKHAKIK